MATIERLQVESGTMPNRPFEAALQMAVSIGDSHEEAVDRFRSSQVYCHLNSLAGSTMKGRLDTGLEDRNLVGTVDEIGERIQDYVDAGVQTFAALLFAADSVEQTIELMELFSENVMGSFAETQR